MRRTAGIRSRAISGFKKASGLANGRDPAHNATGVWGITAPATQYSEVTLGAVSSGGGGPIVRIDRTNTGQTGWLLFLFARRPPSSSGIAQMTPGGGFTAAQPLHSHDRVLGDKVATFTAHPGERARSLQE